MDWMHDELFDGRRLWVLALIDTWSRACPMMRVCRSATAMEVIDGLEEARRRFGLPRTIRVDQGSQSTSKELDLWAYANKVTLDFSRPGRTRRQRLRGKLQRAGTDGVPGPALVPRP